MMAERGIALTHTTILRWVQRYAWHTSFKKLNNILFLFVGKRILGAMRGFGEGRTF